LKIACVGGGPAGLYFALLLKLRQPEHDITVFERSSPGVTRGWGVVFWADLLERLHRSDPVSAREVERASFSWVDQVVDIGGRQVLTRAAIGYGIMRWRLLDVLAARAMGAGVRVEYDHEVTSRSQLPAEADLIVACDGVNSRLRESSQGIRTEVHVGANKYIWLGTDKVFDSFTFPFVQTEKGWVWAHAYGVDAGSSTFIVECSAETWSGLGFATMSHHDCLSNLESIFRRQLEGHRLIGQTSEKVNAEWLNFRTVTNDRWHDGNIVLAGDAAHTTHFTIGSGTKLAIEDAISLVENLQRQDELSQALDAYEKERQAVTAYAQTAARSSAQWYENVARYADLEPRQFSALMSRRSSPLLPQVPPQVYYWLCEASRAGAGARRRVRPKLRKIYTTVRGRYQ